MSTARDEILSRIRSVERPFAPEPPRIYRRAGTLSPHERSALFCERVSDYRAEVRRLANGEVGEAIAAACRELRIAVPPGLPAEWRPAAAIEDHGLRPEELDAVDGVVSGCTVAIAETGTIALTTHPAEGRRALTLVPDLHICVVREDQIVELLPEAMAVLGDLVRDERLPITFVSGPSATSDIELERVEGVHGPRTLIVLVVASEES
jgi:L-lactate dehydrogenase complex protein LldG